MLGTSHTVTVLSVPSYAMSSKLFRALSKPQLALTRHCFNHINLGLNAVHTDTGHWGYYAATVRDSLMIEYTVYRQLQLSQ